MTPLFCMDEMIIHQPPHLPLTSAQPIASLGWGKRPVPVTLCTEAETKRRLGPMGVKLMNNVAAETPHTPTQLLPASQAMGVLSLNMTANAPSQCESLAFSWSRRPLSPHTPLLSFFMDWLRQLPMCSSSSWSRNKTEGWVDICLLFSTMTIVDYFLNGRASGRCVLCAFPQLVLQ